MIALDGQCCPLTQLLLWCYGSRGIAAHNMLWVLWLLWARHNTHNMLWAAMGGPSRVHGVMAREATPDCSPLEFSLRALPRAREVGSASIAKYFLFCPQVKFNNIYLPPEAERWLQIAQSRPAPPSPPLTQFASRF